MCRKHERWWDVDSWVWINEMGRNNMPKNKLASEWPHVSKTRDRYNSTFRTVSQFSPKSSLSGNIPIDYLGTREEIDAACN